jgi:small-conductance mechanosensitive channel
MLYASTKQERLMFAASVTDSAERGLERFFEYLPQLVGAIVLLILGVIVAKILQKIVQGALNGVRFDQTLKSTAAGPYITRAFPSPARFVGRVAYWLVFLIFLSAAVSALNLPVLDKIVNGIYSYIPHIIASVLIFLVAGAISAGSAAFVRTAMGDTPLSKLISAVIPALTMGIAIFMILDELNIAENIVTITYTALIASAALGAALAFGLGGRDVAAQILSQAYESGQKNAGAAKAEVARAKERTQRKVNERRR